MFGCSLGNFWMADSRTSPVQSMKDESVVMNIRTAIVACAVALSGFGLTGQAMSQSQQQVMSDCAKEWDALKAANKTGGKTYQEFNKDCLSKDKTTAKPAAVSPAAAPAAAASKTSAPVAATKKVNLNTATAADLDNLPQIVEARSKVIIEARAKGKFKNWDDFVARKVVPANAEAAIKDLVSF
jgi:competence protein ComEA